MFAFAFLVLLAFFLYRGPIKVHGAPTGRLIERFNAVERTTHWVLAISFVLLSLSGIMILWGKHIVLPWLGYTGNSWLTIVSKNLHNFIGPLFIFSVVVMALLFLKDNLPRSYDIDWLKKFGGMFSKTGEEVPSGRFNAGEKMVYWAGLLGLGAAVSITGLILDFPNWNQGRELMQQANVIHAMAAVLFICLIMGHGYLGTIGMQGAYRAMRDGFVDETCGEGAPRDLVRRSEGRQALRARSARQCPTRCRRRLMRTNVKVATLAIALAVGCGAAWAKIPPPPPLDEKGKAAAEEKKAKDAAAAEKAKADQTAAEDRAVKNFQGNMKKAGKPVPKPVPVAAAAPAKPGAAPAAAPAKADEKKKEEPKKSDAKKS